MNKKKKLLKKDFMLVLIGQIISLFGNQILRYALPLYLLNETGSAMLFGVTMATSFLPMFILAPIGGIVADRVNKRNVMVGLDFSTAAITLLYCVLFKQCNLIVVTIIMLMLLYGIQGLYQPTVQASVPLLVSTDSLTQGNALINMVGSLAGILGPVIGGITFAKFGVEAIVWTAILCFIFSAVMELFIKIPYTKTKREENVFSVAKKDLKDGILFVTKKRPEIGKVGLLLLVINCVFSALIVVGLPVLINDTLGFETSHANSLYGFAQGALALGGLCGGILAGIFGKKMDVRRGGKWLLGCTLSIVPIAICLALELNAYFTYAVLVICCVLMMIFSTILSILLVTYVQLVSPVELLGKVMALLSGLVMCGHPIGQLLYGFLLEQFADCIFAIFIAVDVVAFFVTLIAYKLFELLEINQVKE